MSSLKIEEAPLPAGTAPEPLNQSVQEFRLHHCPRAMPTVSDHHVMPPSMPTHNLHWHASRYYEVRAIWEGNQEKGRPMSHRLSHQSYQTRPRVNYIRPNNSSSCAICDHPWSGEGGRSTPWLRKLDRQNQIESRTGTFSTTSRIGSNWRLFLHLRALESTSISGF